MNLELNDISKEEQIDTLYNRLNRFFFLFLYSSKVENGWVMPIFVCKLLHFSCGVYIFFNF